ncbi:probable receptor-like protein kinase At3g17420 [Ipomoea triloba]|uniref:probable receptor-like protein kinase At3g17420 n=1 Tax=Ipomoea triloba TaxID=35885 RepID=UPI00125D8042|nr:probable receptor-like protein kinase At3g17420 [Ipomoea triloba]
MKRKGLATLMPLRTPEHNEQWWNNDNEHQRPEEHKQSEQQDKLPNNDKDEEISDQEEEEEVSDKHIPPPTPKSPCWRPLAWRMGFPRILSIEEIENMTNGYGDEITAVCPTREKHRVYEGIFLGTPVMVKCFPKDNDEFWSVLEIISHVRHHSILGLIGHCCTDESMFLVYDFPCSYTLEMNLLDDECSKRIPWKMRWNVALEIGAGLRYLQEECENGPVVDISIASSEVAIFHGSSAMLCIVNRARLLKGGTANQNEDLSAKCGEDHREQSKHILADIRGYGRFLIELITGKTEKYLQEEDDDGHHSSFDWPFPELGQDIA